MAAGDRRQQQGLEGAPLAFTGDGIGAHDQGRKCSETDRRLDHDATRLPSIEQVHARVGRREVGEQRQQHRETEQHREATGAQPQVGQLAGQLAVDQQLLGGSVDLAAAPGRAA